MTPGETLRSYREKLGLTVRDVETASTKLSQKYSNPDFALSISRLSDIETKGVVPSIFKLYSLAAIYRRNPADLHKLYGVSFENCSEDSTVVSTEHTHLVSSYRTVSEVEIPIKLDPGFDTGTTFNVGRMIQSWGAIPFAQLSRFSAPDYSYGYIGEGDLTMYPLLLPGSFVQIDENLNKVVNGRWRSEFERPVYFLETRDEYLCCWCEVEGPTLTLRPHPLSPVRTRTFRLGSEVEVLGRVVGVAMRLRVNLDGLPGDRGCE